MTYIYKNQIPVSVMVDGKVTMISPVPEDDAFDDLILDSCRAIFTRPELKGRISGELTPTPGSAAQSCWLVSEIARWIREGDLRSHTQINEAVTAFTDWATRLNELGVEEFKNWQLDLGMLLRLRWFFGIYGTEPLPSKAQILASRKQREEETSEQVRQRNQELREMQEYEKELDRKYHIDDLLDRIVNKLYSLVRWAGEDYDESHPAPSEYHAQVDKREAFIRFNKDRIALLVDSGKSDDAITEEVIVEMIDDLKALGKSEIPPLEPGQQRRYFNEFEFAKFLRKGFAELHKTNKTVLMLGMDGLFVVTIIPIPKPQETRSAVTETAVGGAQ